MTINKLQSRKKFVIHFLNKGTVSNIQRTLKSMQKEQPTQQKNRNGQRHETVKRNMTGYQKNTFFFYFEPV